MIAFNLFPQFIEALENNHVRYAVLRGFESLPDSFSNDIDFGIHPLDIDAFFIALDLFQKKYEIKILLVNSRLDVLKLLINKINCVVNVDFWFGFNYAGIYYLDIHNLIENRVKFKNFYVPKTNDEVSLSFLKELLHMNRLRKDKVNILKAKINDCELIELAMFFDDEFKKKMTYSINNRIYNLTIMSIQARLKILFVNFKKYGYKKTFNNIIQFLYYRVFPSKNTLVNKLLKILIIK